MHCQETLLGAIALAVGNVHGDQYVENKVNIPTTLTEKQQKLLEEWEGIVLVGKDHRLLYHSF